MEYFTIFNRDTDKQSLFGGLCGQVHRFSFQSLKHPEHINGEFTELNLERGKTLMSTQLFPLTTVFLTLSLNHAAVLQSVSSSFPSSLH